MEISSGSKSIHQDGVQGIARRSVSIFSRRGTATPKQETSSLYQAMEDSPQWMTDSPSPSAAKKSCWLRKSNQLGKLKGGTILHAVRSQTAGHSMSPLEIAMATSPNEEILQAIGRSTEPDPLPSRSLFHNEWTQSTEHATPPQRQGSFNSRIGVWRDGVAFWDVPEERPQTAQPSRSISTGFNKSARPRLSVVIPARKLQQVLGNDVPLPRRLQTPVHVAPALVTSKHSLSVQSNSSNELAIHPAFRTTSPFGEAHVTEPRSLPSHENSRSSISSNTIFQDDTFDATSCYSRCSSMTSVDGEDPNDDCVRNPDWNHLNMPKRSGSAAFSITSPVKAGIFDDASAGRDCCGTSILHSVSSSQHLRNHQETPRQHVSHGENVRASSATSLDINAASSPTLSEAVCDLQAQLSAITVDTSIVRAEDEVPADISDYESTVGSLSRAPTVPKRSRKREWIQPASFTPLSQHSKPPISQTALPTRRQSVPCKLHERASHSHRAVKRASSVRSGTLDCVDAAWKPLTSLNELPFSDVSLACGKFGKPSLVFAHEPLCFMIMKRLSTFKDLEAMSMLNRSTRQTYKKNELQLLKSVVYNASPPAWELREWSPLPFDDMALTGNFAYVELTPSAYMSSVRSDQKVIRELRDLILVRGQSFLRPETISALATHDSARFDDAIYRIWCFCRIFGSERGRENDLKGQLDWLRGGPLAHQKGCAATLDFKPEFDMDGVLLNPPDHFAMGNGKGLSAEQLYDISEIWECLSTIMQGYEGRVAEAQSCGIYQKTAHHLLDAASQQHMLNEWVSYILTLGPSVVLELSRFSQDEVDAGFGFANMNGWTDWTPPHPGMSRRGFLKEPVSQLYEEQLVTSTLDGQAIQVGKRLLRRRQTEEIKVAYHRASVSAVNNGDTTCALSRRDSALAPEVSKKGRQPSMSRSPGAGGWRVHPATWSPKKVSPIIEDRVETFNRLSMLNFEGVADDTANMAIGKIVDMGFTTAQAKEALRITDMGNGLRVDRAVDWLLRQM